MKRKTRGGNDAAKMRKIWTIVCLIVVCATALLGRGVLVYKLYPLQYEDYITQYSEESGVDPYLVCAMIKAESSFRPGAVSGDGAVGLMQLMPSTAQEVADKLGVEDFTEDMLKDPEVNIRFGCYHLSYLIDYFDGNQDYAIAAYNAGMGNVREWVKTDPSLKEIPYPETENYLKKVKAYYEIYQGLYQL